MKKLSTHINLSSRSIFSFLLIIFLGISNACKKNDILPVILEEEQEEEEEISTNFLLNPTATTCHENREIIAPSGYEIMHVTDVSFEGRLKSFQFINEEVGYALGTYDAGGYLEVFKTVNGGLSWFSLNLDQIKQHPRDMLFFNDQEGIITVHDVTGCPPPNCQHKCVILKTVDGGANWEEIEYPNLKGIINHPTIDNDGNIYALVSLFPEQDIIIKSTDQATTWNVIHTSDQIDMRHIDFGMKLWDQHLFIPGKDDALVKMDFEGTIVAILEPDLRNIADVVFHENQLYVSGTSGIRKSIDGGENWKTIYDYSGLVLSVSSQEHLLALLTTSHCSGDIFASLDCIAPSEDAGISWDNPMETRNLSINFDHASELSEKDLLLLSDNRFYLLSKL